MTTENIYILISNDLLAYIVGNDPASEAGGTGFKNTRQ